MDIVAEITSLLWAIAFLAVVVIVLWLLIRPPKWLVNLLTSIKFVETVRVGNIEAQIRRPPEPTRQEPDDGVSEEETLSEAVLPTRKEEIESDGDTAPPPADAGENTKEESLFTSMLRKFSEGDYQSGLEAARQFASTQEDPGKRVDYEAMALSLAFSFGHHESLNELEGFVEKHKLDPSVYKWLGRAYQKVQLHDRAIKVVNEGLGVAEEEDTILDLLIDLAKNLQMQGQPDESIIVLEERIDKLGEPKVRSRGLRALAELKFDAGETRSAFELWEAALSLVPEDRELRFDLAYRYSGQDAPAMALWHYTLLLQRDPKHRDSLNNAGVAAAALALKGKSVEFYRKAEELGNTLATANLAYKMIESGFWLEAQEALDGAQKDSKIHENVPKARGYLEEVRAEEKEKLQSVQARSQRQAEWCRKVANASFKECPGDLSGHWRGGTPATLHLKERDEGAIEGDFKFSPGGSSHTLRGVRQGCAVHFSWKEVKKDSKPDLIASLYPPSSGSGRLIIEGGKMIGFSLGEGDKLDPGEDKGYTEWRLTKREGRRRDEG